MDTENSSTEEKSNAVLYGVSISSIHKLITKYEDKIICAENLKHKGTGYYSEVPTKQSIERLDVRIYERKTFVDDLKSLLNEC